MKDKKLRAESAILGNSQFVPDDPLQTRLMFGLVNDLSPDQDCLWSSPGKWKYFTSNLDIHKKQQII